MYSFKNDYSEGAHPRIMQALLDTNLEQTDGYGTDPHCERARALIREKIACPEADVHFLVGGTQANLTVVAAALRPYQYRQQKDRVNPDLELIKNKRRSQKF